jgi:hypothetical protein
LEKEIWTSKNVVSLLQKTNNHLQKGLDKFQGQIEDHVNLLENAEVDFGKLHLA